MSVRFENKSIVIDGVPTFIYSGEFEYFRTPPEVWEDRIAKLKAGGLGCVGLYFAWNFHSPSAGEYDFRSPGCNLHRLLDIVQENGLYAIARPGPYICNEWDLGGYPAWLLTLDSGDWRTADPKHLRWLREWYREVNSVLALRQQDSGGPIILYQIENEYRWEDNDLLNTLYDYAREDGIVVPLIGNHDGGAVSSGAKVSDGVDTYTNPGERYRWRGYNEAMYRRIGPDAPHMVLEFRGCDMSLWGDPAPSEERLPSAWIAGQEKLFTATGANLTNRFIAAGGLTPRAFHSDHITTEYGTRAAVAPWGEVTDTESFAHMRLWGEFVSTANRQLAVSKPWPMGWGTDNPQVECLARRGPDGVFYTLINLSNKPQTLRLDTPQDSPICQPLVHIAPGQIKVLVADLKLDRLTIAYSTAELLKVGVLSGRTYVVVYGEVDTEARIAFDISGSLVAAEVTFQDTPVAVGVQVGDQHVTIYAVSRQTAASTWFIQTPQGFAPLFGGIDLALPNSPEGSSQIEAVPGHDLNVVTPEAVESIRFSGEAFVRESVSKGLVRWSYPTQAIDTPPSRIGGIQALVEDDWTRTSQADDGHWRSAMATGQAREVILIPGHYRWQKQFDLDPVESIDMIELLGVSSAEVEVYLNGVHLGRFPEVRPAGYPFLSEFGVALDASRALKAGTNLLSVDMNIVGRHNCGQPIYSGLNAPVVLRTKHREEWSLPRWQCSPFTDRRWLVSELSSSPEPAQVGYDRTDWQEIDFAQAGTHTWTRQGDIRHRVRWYHSSVQVPKEASGRPLFLETSPVEEAWVYVNGTCVGRKLSGESSVFDLSNYSNDPNLDIVIAVRHNWYFFTSTWGLSDAPKLLSFAKVLDPEWRFIAGTHGENQGFAIADSGWSALADTPTARDIWISRTVDLLPRADDLVAPIYVEVSGWGKSADLFWNGAHIGLYSELGPQHRFWVPDPLIRGHNRVSLRVSGYDLAKSPGHLGIAHYSVRRRLPLELDVRSSF